MNPRITELVTLFREKLLPDSQQADFEEIVDYIQTLEWFKTIANRAVDDLTRTIRDSRSELITEIK